MTTATTSIPFTTATRPTLEALVDQLVESIFGGASESPDQSLARNVHDARRLRQVGNLDRALALLAGVDMARAQDTEARWVYAEWFDLARRRFADRGALVYSPDIGRAAVLAPRGDSDGDGTLEVLAVLGMRWRTGKTVSRRSLRGLRPLAGVPA